MEFECDGAGVDELHHVLTRRDRATELRGVAGGPDRWGAGDGEDGLAALGREEMSQDWRLRR